MFYCLWTTTSCENIPAWWVYTQSSKAKLCIINLDFLLKKKNAACILTTICICTSMKWVTHKSLKSTFKMDNYHFWYHSVEYSFIQITHPFSLFLYFDLILLSVPVPVEERVVGPRDLQVSELAHSSLRLTWSQATSDVTGYRLLVTPLSSKGHLLYPQQRQVKDYEWAWQQLCCYWGVIAKKIWSNQR